jgi:hypothetical protein
VALARTNVLKECVASSYLTVSDIFVQGNYGSSAQPPAASYGGPSPGIGGPAGAGYHSNYQQYGYDSYYQQPPPSIPPYSGVSPTVKYLSIGPLSVHI